MEKVGISFVSLLWNGSSCAAPLPIQLDSYPPAAANAKRSTTSSGADLGCKTTTRLVWWRSDPFKRRTPTHAYSRPHSSTPRGSLADVQVHILHPITDPELTAVGREQATDLAHAFRRESAVGMPLPTRWYTSPMRRPGQTVGLTWGWLFGKGENDLHAQGILARSKDQSLGVPAEVVEVSPMKSDSENDC